MPRLPRWLDLEPREAAARYAWAVLQLRRGAAAAALRAFEGAIAEDPALAGAGDAPDVARLAVAKASLASGDAARAIAQCAAITSPRLLRAAALLVAMATVKRATRDGEPLAAVVERLATSPAGSERDAAGAISLELERARVRSLIAGGELADARRALSAMASDPDVIYLRATVSILEGHGDAVVEGEIEAASASDPAHAGLLALLAELRGLRDGPGARVQTLERGRGAAAQSALFEEALGCAYRSAHRVLDAKRKALAQLRRAGGVAHVSPALAAELRLALALESPPARPPKEPSVLALGTLPARADVLVARATRRGAVARPALARLEAALASGDLTAAHDAELALIEVLGSAT